MLIVDNPFKRLNFRAQKSLLRYQNASATVRGQEEALQKCDKVFETIYTVHERVIFQFHEN